MTWWDWKLWAEITNATSTLNVLLRVVPITRSSTLHIAILYIYYENKSFNSKTCVQVNIFQKHLFLHQLSHNMTKNCSLNYKFSTWKLQAQNMLRTCCVHKLFWMSKQKQFVYTTCSQHVLSLEFSCTEFLMNNLLSYCGLVDARISASEKGLPVLTVILHLILVDILYSFFTSNRLLCMHTSVVKMIVCESVNLKSAG